MCKYRNVNLIKIIFCLLITKSTMIKEKSKDADPQKGPRIGEILVHILSDTFL